MTAQRSTPAPKPLTPKQAAARAVQRLETLGAAELARELGRSRSWLYEHLARLIREELVNDHIY